MAFRRTVMVVACCVGMLAGLAPPASSAPVKPTVVSKSTPFTKAGLLKAKLNSVFIDVTTCYDSSVGVAKGVFTCGPSAAYLPACWKTPGTDVQLMVCLRQPGAKKVQAWTFDPGSVDLEPGGPVGDPMPWRIVLDNGAKCAVRLGGAWSNPPEGYVYSYSCSGPGSIDALLTREDGDTLDTTSAHFTVRGTTLGGSGAIKTLGVKKVVYAGGAPAAAKVAAKSGSMCPAKKALGKKVRALYPTFRAIGQVTCTSSWALTGITDGMSGGYALFQKVDGSWKYRNRSTLCLQKGMPAAFAWVCYVG